MKIIQTTIAPTELDVSFNLKANVSLLGVASGIATLDGNGKVPASQLDSLVDSVNGYTGIVVLNKSDLSLGDVDNTSDVDKPVSTATQTALNLKADLSLVGVPSGIASLDGAGKVPAAQLPEMASAVTSVNTYTGEVVLAKADVGLADVDNTSDADKPVSTATQAALDLKQDVLVSTLNVKSINGASIVGSGNLNVTGGHTIEDEGTPLAQRTKLNFIGNAVNVTDNSGDDSTEVTINLPETGAGLNLGDWDDSGTFTTGVNFDGNNAKLLIPGITTATRTAATPIEKELLFDTDLNEVYYGDGTTQGGIKLAKSTDISNGLTLDLISEPLTPDTGKLIIYASALDGLIYKKDDQGIVTEIGTGGGREVLTSNRTYYVSNNSNNGNILGSDSNDGLSLSTPFLTIPKFFNTLATIDKNGFDVDCQVADGTYSITQTIQVKDGIGEGIVTLRGNNSNPSNCVITSANNIVYFQKWTTSRLTIEGFRFTNTGANNNTVFLGLYDGITLFKNLDFGVMSTGAQSAQWNILASFKALVIPVGNFTISGSCRAHALLNGQAYYIDDFGINPPGSNITVTLANTPNFSSGFLDVYGSSGYAMAFTRQTFTGSATGRKYLITGNALIDTGGGGTSYLPGNTSGTIAAGSGGIYL